MKRTLVVGILALALEMSISLGASAQGTQVLSNLEEPNLFYNDVASDAWFAVTFRTGLNPGGYRLDSVSLLMGEATGNPAAFSVSLYDMTTPNTNEPFTIKSKIDDLSGPDPGAGGVFSYEASGIILLPSTHYSIVLTSETPMDAGSYRWGGTDTQGYTTEDGWAITAVYLESVNGVDWNVVRLRLQYAIYATPIPTLSIQVAPPGEEAEINWVGVEGVTYQLQTRSSLTEGDWTDLGEPIVGQDTGITVTTPVVPGQAYFRVAVLPAE